MANSVNRRASGSGWGYPKDVVDTVKPNTCDRPGHAEDPRLKDED